MHEGQHERIGPFDLEFIAVNHSIPDALAVAIKTRAGTVLATGDFKMDQLPLDGRLTDLREFARLGEEGVDLFMVDSTNADVPGFTPLERSIGPVLDEVIARSPRRVIVASFSSHVHRVQQVLDAAAFNGRRVALLGRSMVRNMTIAADLGYLKVPEGVLIDYKKAGDIPDDEIVYMSTGSQGEPMAVLVAHGEPRPPDRDRRGRHRHPRVEPHPRQRERRLPRHRRPHEARRQRRAQGQREGARLRPRRGGRAALLLQHPEAEERAADPRRVPAPRSRTRSSRSDTGIPEQNTFIGENGTVYDLRDGEVRVVGQLDLGFVYVDGSTVGEITDADLKDRRILGEEGFISVIVVVDASTGRIIVGPEIHARGFAEDDAVFDEVKPKISAALLEAAQNGVRDPHALQQVVRRTVGTWVNRRLRRRPMLVPLVIEA